MTEQYLAARIGALAPPRRRCRLLPRFRRATGAQGVV